MKTSDYHLQENLPKSIGTGNIKEIAETVCRQFHKINPDILLLYDRIDDLPSELLDHLAVLCHTDDYDSGLDLSIKRQLIKNSILVHRHKGTKLAVETHVSSLFGEAHVKEWFEYGGDAYIFRMTVDGRSFKEDRGTERLLKAIASAKNERSQLEDTPEGITAQYTNDLHIPYGMALPVTPTERIEIALKENSGVEHATIGLLTDDPLRRVRQAAPKGIQDLQSIFIGHGPILPRHIEAPHEPIELHEYGHETGRMFLAHLLELPRQGARQAMILEDNESLRIGLALPKSNISHVRVRSPRNEWERLAIALRHTNMAVRHVEAKAVEIDPSQLEPMRKSFGEIIGAWIHELTPRSLSPAVGTPDSHGGRYVGILAGEMLPRHVRAKPVDMPSPPQIHDVRAGAILGMFHSELLPHSIHAKKG